MTCEHESEDSRDCGNRNSGNRNSDTSMENLVKEYGVKGKNFVKKHGKLILLIILVYIIYKKFIAKKEV